MLDDGLYTITYRGKASDPADCDRATVVMRNGKILGSDLGGGVFVGSYVFDAGKRKSNLHVRLRVPGYGVLVTGFEAGPEGDALDIVGSLERGTASASATVDVAGDPVEIRLTYLGALPH